MKKILTLAVVFVLFIPLFSVILPRAYATVTLTNGYVDPGNAPATTTFYYYATYYDSSGRAPELGCVVIDGSNSQFMHLYNGVPSNGVYRYGTTLAVGTHNYYFYFNIGGGGTIYLGYPSSPFSGPIVRPIQRLLSVSCAHDSPNPPNGNWYFDDNQYISCTVTSPVTEGYTVWTCTGWTGTGSVPASGSSSSTGSFTITQDSTITWNWYGTVPQRTLTVNSGHDSPVPGIGPHTYNNGDPVTCSVTSPVTEGGTVWTCTGWTGTGSVPSSGTGKSTGPFTITQDSSITWNWQSQAIYSISIGAHCNTESKDVSVSLWIDSSTAYYTPYAFSNLHGTHTFTASQHDTNGHSFKQWSTGSTSLTITVSSDGAYTAYYEALQRTLTVSSTHDSPVPSNGPHTYTDGQSATCSVSSTVTEGSTVWTCTGWYGTGSVPSSGSGTSTSFIITKDSTITWNWQARSIGDLILVDFSPVQVVYGASELVANKPAVFRAIVQSTFSQSQPEPLIIRFTYSGGSLPDYSSQIGPNAQVTVFIQFASNNLRQSGTFTWTANLDPGNQIVETNEGNNMVTGSKAVIETNYISILYVPLRSSLDSPISMTDLKLMQQYGDQYILETFPTPGVYSQIYVPSPGVLAYDNIVTLLGTLRVIDQYAKSGGFDRTVVILPNKDGHWLRDRILGGPDAIGYVHPLLPTVCMVENTYYAAIAHEIGHTYGRPGGFFGEEYDTNPPGNRAEGYDVGRHKEVKTALCFMGLTSQWTKLGDPMTALQKDGHNYGDFPGGYWICNTCYEGLLGRFKKAGDPEILYMGGIVFENGTIVFPACSRMSNGVPDLLLGNSGNFMILFLDDTNNLIAQTGFNASFVYLPEGLYVTAFSLTVEYPSSTRKVQLMFDDNLIVEQNVTLNPPTVSVVSPNGGEVFTAGEDCLISWNSTDLDGDQLTHDLFYSEDVGKHWTPVAMDLNQTSFLWNTSGLNRGADYLVKVVANDGLNTGENISGGSFTIKVHDIAPSTVIPSKSNVGQNYTMSFSTTIENRGDFSESTNVTLCVNATVVGTIENVYLDTENATLYFLWNTTGLGCGNYNIISWAQPVPGETNTEDNNYTCDFLVHVGVPGDISGPTQGVYDGTCNMRDVQYLILRFNTNPSSSNWNPNADVNDDGTVNMRDIQIAILNFNQHE